MSLSTFDTTFDFTFARISIAPPVVLDDVGGDGGGGISGSVLPLATSSARLASCLHPEGQGWERWAGVPMSTPSYLLPFILAVPMPDEVNSSPYCTQPIQILDADTGVVVLLPTGSELHRLTNGNTLYLIHTGSQLYTGNNIPASLPTGTYRIQVADAVSEPFGVRCTGCSLYRIRLSNPTRIGDLLYGSFGFEQIFYVEGDLDGPSFEETETRSGTEKTGGTVKKSWTLNLDSVTEPIVDALALSGLHRLVEVSLVDGAGIPYRPIQALAYEAKASTSDNASGGYDVSLKLPVSLTEWKSGAAAAGCLTDGAASGVLTEVICEVT